MGYRIEGNRIYTDAEWGAKCRNEWILDKLSNIDFAPEYGLADVVRGLGKVFGGIIWYTFLALVFVVSCLTVRPAKWLYRRWTANRERPVLNLRDE
jgi:hypothetical protein